MERIGGCEKGGEALGVKNVWFNRGAPVLLYNNAMHRLRYSNKGTFYIT